MALKTVDLTPTIGTMVETDVETLVSGKIAGELKDLIRRRGVILFRGLDMNDEQQLAFTRTLGPVLDEKSGEVYKVTWDPRESPKLYLYTPGNFFWHIDRTDADIPPFITMLNAKRIDPEGGGDTEFANTYAAYEALFESDKRLIENLRVVHRVSDSFRFVPNPSAEQIAAWNSHAPKVHPLVWHHHDGRKSLILSTSGNEVVGMDLEEGRALLDRLMAWATQPQFVYRHKWQVGDIVIWDNTGTMHRALPYPEDSPRLHHRTTVIGSEPFDPRRMTARAA
ncbi:MAG: TauD/TfdA family dioxygenase [Novosphingobium sp.]|nr:TauD/TfdA family dioxygenase [Novosphingobium sp.]